ncbi:DNA-binding transcriptional MerR regulator [Murinocardiopsis flavida]|uniref:DNA-binding transcriptional MerR regulator n=1 Tax=Murinocardiopsis flavida TaxID=645275 RepID=A0A2P8DNJ3_9ACTN|nr:MerR family transcriptional regulator [Murinocardiopsis flavida]PSK98792.1 DNA-binding transcriptional MerR regulator [Murinocardiopsis flavida]
MRIGELSRRSGVSSRALRYYEEQRLLRPVRRPSGYREFSEDDLDSVRRIRLLLAAGLGTAMIAEILPCMVEGNEGLAAGCPELLDALGGEHDRIAASIAELESARTLLARIIATPVPTPG